MTVIDSHTKIATLLKKDAGVLDALVAVSPKFEKLRNPLLRRLMAGRTSLIQAAQIGGCDMREIAEALKPLGFSFKDREEDESDKLSAGASASLPGFMEVLDESACEELDVRMDLAEGKDPLKKIMTVIKNLPSDRILKLVNTFEPAPLIRLLEKKGYESYIKKNPSGEVHTFFKLKDRTKEEKLKTEITETASEATFRSKLNDFGAKVNAVDVSQMEMPMPMVTILEALSGLPGDFALLVQHKRIPVFLLSELKERNFGYLLYQAGAHDVKLLIYYKN